MKESLLQKHRKAYAPKLPPALRLGPSALKPDLGEKTQSVSDQEEVRKLFPHTYGMPMVTYTAGEKVKSDKPLGVGVVLSGGQAPGGHNVICGLYDGLKDIHSESRLIGFLGGPSGLENNRYSVLNDSIINEHRNTGGFDIIGSGRTKLETEKQFDRCIQTIEDLDLQAIVIIGGDDSNTNAAVLAEYMKAKGKNIQIIGVPKTIDGDLKNERIPTSFGFDTAVKTYAELVGNIQRDSRSAKKYWHFIKLMGRSASHIALEVALQTRPNAALISEEVEAGKMSLPQIIGQLADIIVSRASDGKDYGVVLVPEGLIEFIPSIKSLISRLNDSLASHEAELAELSIEGKVERLSQWLSADEATTLGGLPAGIQEQLLLDRDPHGNVQVSRIDTELLLLQMVETELKKRASNGSYKGKFSWQRHFFGYEGRCAAPSNFDADYCYSLGMNASALIRSGFTGYMSSISNLSAGVDAWQAGGVPITMLLNMEQRHGAMKPVIQKALVELEGPVFKEFSANREDWAKEDAFLYPGPIQYFGPSEVCDQVTQTLRLEGG